MTAPPPKNSYNHAIQQARQSIKQGNRRTARLWAEKAAKLAPLQEEPWLIIAALAAPRASLEYLKHALEINPGSQHARKGMHWAIQRYRSEILPSQHFRPSVSAISDHLETTQRKTTILYPWIILFMAVIAAVVVWFGTPSFSFASERPSHILALAQEWVSNATQTPTQTPTSQLTLTSTASPTPSDTPTLTPSPFHPIPPTNTPSITPTETNTPVPTATPPPTQKPTEEPTQESYDPPPQMHLPPRIEKGEIWIDVDLTNQQLQVYKGQNLLNSFIVSTGTWRTPTVTGQYQIYVKYPAADMAGPGYYLPNVPYVMYFYEGYGIHGTYWHNNFGTPMSHGCINLRTDNAEWVYNKASIGTVVNIHY